MDHLAPADVRRARLASHLLASRPDGSEPADVASWFAAMQAQELPSVLWSLGVRLPGRDRAAVEQALAGGSVLRTWTMRSTIHAVAARDAGWLLRTTGARTLRPDSARWRALGLDRAIAERAMEVFAEALRDTGRATRPELVEALQRAGIDAGGQRAYHLLRYASTSGLLCLGLPQGGEQTFVLLARWAPQQHAFAGDEALSELALRYFRSHGPVTRRDFMGWSGLTSAEATLGIAGLGSRLRVVQTDTGDAYVDPAALDRIPGEPTAQLLPAFDEYILGARDRASIVPDGHLGEVSPGGGVFRATVLVDGAVAGTWRRRTTGRGVMVDIDLFAPLSSRAARAVDEAAEAYAAFLDQPLIRH